ncbi:MAG: 3-dehydroquinate synthase [Armatimonadota bacterium]|nr:3-dehydroquinate synthase [Armatimonadota bacterium]
MRVTVGETYEVAIGPYDDDAVSKLEPRASSTFLITDENVWSSLGRNFTNFDAKMVLPAGESTKSVRRWNECLVWLLQRGADRQSVILAVGGGVVGDLAGFVAASYMRGIRYVNVATSLVAQVDSSIGGKTAVDLPEGKNLVGAFHQPSAVYCDPAHLETLPEREYVSGMAEAIKYGAILDEVFLAWQEDNFHKLRDREPEAIHYLVQRCCELKAQIVTADPFEKTGERAKLNFGHTVGHALEHGLDFTGLLHGEAIAVGMIIEAEIGERMGVTMAGTRNRLQHVLSRWGLPVKVPSSGLAERMVASMAKDKKAESGEIAMSLTMKVGECELVRAVDPGLVLEALAKI